jgi:hypothetical protein
MDLTNGAQIRTGHDSEVGFAVGYSAIIKLGSDSELGFARLTARPDLGRDAIRTALVLWRGEVQCIVKKLPPESSFQIRAGEVTVDVRKGDFQLSADGSVEAIAGAPTVLAAGKTYLLRAGEYFDSKKCEVGKIPNLALVVSSFITDSSISDYAIHDYVERRPPSLVPF